MRVRDSNWMQIEALLRAGEDRAVLPLGSIEQHAWLSLAVDALLAEKVTAEAAEPLGVPAVPDGQELMARHHGLRLRWHNWWAAPRTMAFRARARPAG